jgi:hypothetical protein
MNTDHLSDWQIEELLIGLVGRGEDSSRTDAGLVEAHTFGYETHDPALWHLQGCEFCRSRKKRLQESVSLYREAALLKTIDAFDSAFAANGGMAAHKMHTSLSHRPFWGWGKRVLAFLFLLAVLVPAFVARERERREAREVARDHLLQEQAKDNLLLEEVDEEVTESVPHPLQSLTRLVVANGTNEE